MALCFSTRASVATVLSTHPCISSCLWVNKLITSNFVNADSQHLISSRHGVTFYSWLLNSSLHLLIIPPVNKVVGGYICFTPSIRLSVRPFLHPSIRKSHVRPASGVRFVAPTVLVGSISCLYILSSNFRRCVTCKVSCKISKFECLAIFLNL